MRIFKIDHIGRNYILFEYVEEKEQFCAASQHVQPLFDLIPNEKPFHLRVDY